MEAEGTKRARSRRRRRRQREVEKGLIALVRDARTGRLLFAGMTVLAIGYAAWITYVAWIVSFGYGSIWMGMTHAEAEYMMGPPSVGQEQGQTWTYTDKGSRTSLAFDGSGHLQQADCALYAASETGCPGAGGVNIGTAEAEVKLRLGSPDSEYYQAGEKILTYDGLGLIFRLKLGQVSAIRHVRVGLSGGLIAQALYLMVP